MLSFADNIIIVACVTLNLVSEGITKEYRIVINFVSTSHGETDCIRNAGRRPHYKGKAIFCTRLMCQCFNS